MPSRELALTHCRGREDVLILAGLQMESLNKRTMHELENAEMLIPPSIQRNNTTNFYASLFFSSRESRQREIKGKKFNNKYNT